MMNWSRQSVEMFKTLSAFNKNQGPLTKNFVWENFEDGSKMTVIYII